MRLGGAYLLRREYLRGGLLFALDAVFPNDNDAKVHFGAEYRYHRIFAARLGFKGGYEVQGATMGFGIYYRNLRFDYAWMPIDYELGDSHRFSINVFPSL